MPLETQPTPQEEIVDPVQEEIVIEAENAPNDFFEYAIRFDDAEEIKDSKNFIRLKELCDGTAKELSEGEKFKFSTEFVVGEDGFTYLLRDIRNPDLPSTGTKFRCRTKHVKIENSETAKTETANPETATSENTNLELGTAGVNQEGATADVNLETIAAENVNTATTIEGIKIGEVQSLTIDEIRNLSVHNPNCITIHFVNNVALAGLLEKLFTDKEIIEDDLPTCGITYNPLLFCWILPTGVSYGPEIIQWIIKTGQDPVAKFSNTLVGTDPIKVEHMRPNRSYTSLILAANKQNDLFNEATLKSLIQEVNKGINTLKVKIHVPEGETFESLNIRKEELKATIKKIENIFGVIGNLIYRARNGAVAGLTALFARYIYNVSNIVMEYLEKKRIYEENMLALNTTSGDFNNTLSDNNISDSLGENLNTTLAHSLNATFEGPDLLDSLGENVDTFLAPCYASIGICTTCFIVGLPYVTYRHHLERVEDLLFKLSQVQGGAGNNLELVKHLEELNKLLASIPDVVVEEDNLETVEEESTILTRPKPTSTCREVVELLSYGASAFTWMATAAITLTTAVTEVLPSDSIAHDAMSSLFTPGYAAFGLTFFRMRDYFNNNNVQRGMFMNPTIITSYSIILMNAIMAFSGVNKFAEFEDDRLNYLLTVLLSHEIAEAGLGLLEYPADALDRFINRFN